MKSPQWKVIALLILADIVFIGTVYFASTTVMLNTYMMQEGQENRQHISRLLDTFNLKVTEMNNTAAGMADNDDLYRYIQGPCAQGDAYSPEIAEFAATHFTKRTFADLHINFLYTAKLDGSECLLRAYDSKAQTLVMFPQELMPFLQPGNPVIVKALTMGAVTGIIVLPEGPLLISARPILNSRGEGPAAGLLVVGQYVNDTALKSISQATHLTITSSGINNPNMDPDFRWALSILQNSNDFYVFRQIDRDTMGNYTVLHDLFGKEALLLRVETSRMLVNNGMRAVHYFNALIAGLVIFFSIIAFFFNERSRRNRLAQLEAEDRLQQTESYYRTLTETIPDWIWELNPNNQYTYVSPRVEDILGYTPQEVIGKTLYDITPQSEWPKMNGVIQQILQRGGSFRDFECFFQHKDGRLVSVETNGAAILNLQGEVISYRGVNRDVTERLEIERERRTVEEKLRRMEARYRQMMEQINAVTYLLSADDAATTIYISPQCEILFGYKPDEWINNRELWSESIHPDDRGRVLAMHQHVRESNEDFRMDYRMITKSGKTVWVHDEATMVPAAEDQPAQWSGVIYEITERKKLEEELRFIGSHDALTGLYNRSHFNAELALLQNNRRGFPVSIVMGDMDNLKTINDTLGHAAGDEQIILAGHFLRESLRPDDVVARVGGDEYAAILKSTDETAAAAITKRLRSNLEAYKKLHPAMTADLSLGYATGLTHEDSLEEVMKRADQMMYEEKAKRKAMRNAAKEQPR